MSVVEIKDMETTATCISIRQGMTDGGDPCFVYKFRVFRTSSTRLGTLKTERYTPDAYIVGTRYPMVINIHGGTP